MEKLTKTYKLYTEEQQEKLRNIDPDNMSEAEEDFLIGLLGNHILDKKNKPISQKDMDKHW